ncbi:serine protein kinase RIO [Candidatus Heimdallarchaeota archaeon]|nr:MAG: serine protein kinase RIO [Candidatus Heimdallarchaeota archaeon]
MYVKKMSDKEIDRLDVKVDQERIREKDRNTLKVIESVFDFQTSMLIVKLMNKGIIKDIGFCVSTGKEANVYHGIGYKGEELAIKIYRTTTAEFKRNWMYVEGDPRFKGYKKGTYAFIYTWARKEFKNLKRMNDAKIRVPVPITVDKNVLVMEFIGKKEKSAPLIREAKLKKPHKIYGQIIDFIFKLYDDATMVHADLSEYNILFFNKKPVFIDVSQSVLIAHPYAPAFLYRDIQNINRYFSGLRVDVIQDEELYEEITGTVPNPKIMSMEFM